MSILSKGVCWRRLYYSVFVETLLTWERIPKADKTREKIENDAKAVGCSVTLKGLRKWNCPYMSMQNHFKRSKIEL